MELYNFQVTVAAVTQQVLVELRLDGAKLFPDFARVLEPACIDLLQPKSVAIEAVRYKTSNVQQKLAPVGRCDMM